MSSPASEFAAAELGELFRAGVRRADPESLIAKSCAKLTGDSYTVLALGKAAVSMARGARRALGDRVVGGLIVTHEGADDVGDLPVMIGAHPVPDHRSERAGRRLLELARDSKSPVLFLISGGGSSLAAVPVAGLSLADKCDATLALSRAGASITELNSLRANLSAIKGGRLARACTQPSITFVLSDVIGDDPADIASGPTAVATKGPDDAIAVCRAYGLWSSLPAAVRRYLEGAPRARSVPAGEAKVTVAAPLSTVADLIAQEARDRGVSVVGPKLAMFDDVHRAAARLENELRALPPGDLFCGYGEVTIDLGASPGRGGRAHHLALLLARALAGESGEAQVAGTHGIDGNAPSAGAIVDGRTWEALRGAGVDAEAALDDFDSYSALKAIGATVESGRTGVNHADIVLLRRA